ncbi:hypothetical protein P3T76_000392 [Phytophthora citrophthora]|uniref:THH1/TOM1/TOM3 domain-containing protein n=1 Tax=Phytophthora citrophthora TaxID=4793 RepID=A0AAD9H049_9STRA|nr:hypothetical protein P3T76_000392 [Phytophthora citrophthora]
MPYFLALCYVLITAMTVNKYMEVRGVLKRHQHTTWSTVQLLILSVALGSFFRSATFSTLCILDSQATADLPTGITGNNPWTRGSIPPDFGEEDEEGATRGKAGSHAQAELDFYNKVVAVLFNLPDFLFVSSYLLLVLVWAETFQSVRDGNWFGVGSQCLTMFTYLQSRRHWFSAAVFRRKWMIFYLVFNGGLYLTQLVLYASLFLYDKDGIFDDENQDRLSVIPAMIFYLVAAADLFLPIIIFSTWLYLTLSLSGFPFKSQSAKLRLQRVGRLVMAWSFGRILYSVMTLLTFTKGWFNVHRENASTQAMLLVVVFFAAELIPIYLTLDKRLLAMLSVENYEPLLESAEIYRSKMLDQIQSWERDIHAAIDKVQTISQKEKNLLQLHLETHPLPFQPSPVLVTLLKNDRRRRSELDSSSAQSKLQRKSADYLERKVESEMRQHYELQNAQNCGKWKQFHLRVSEARHLLASGIERDYREFCRQLQIPSDKLAQPAMQHQDRDSQQNEFFPCLASDDNISTMPVEDTLQLHLAQEWVYQDRFNIQEAFTNQTKKLQEDLDVFLDQQETEFLKKREKVLNQQCMKSGTESEPKSVSYNKANSQFLNNVKRGMLLRTEPSVSIELEERLASSGSKPRSSSRHSRSDVTDEVQDKLDKLQRQLQARKEVNFLVYHFDNLYLNFADGFQAAEAKHKEDMQWIGRKCAHLFTQLDSKETEAKIVAMMLEEEITQNALLHHRLSDIV